jgi:trimethylamine:corrinoid methyltransferase-like protein
VESRDNEGHVGGLNLREGRAREERQAIDVLDRLVPLAQEAPGIETPFREAVGVTQDLERRGEAEERQAGTQAERDVALSMRKAGAQVDAKGLVRMDWALVLRTIASAPETFTVTPRNPDQSL